MAGRQNTSFYYLFLGIQYEECKGPLNYCEAVIYSNIWNPSISRVNVPLFGYKNDGKDISFKTELSVLFNGVSSPGTRHCITFAVLTNSEKYTTCSLSCFCGLVEWMSKAIFVLTRVDASLD